MSLPIYPIIVAMLTAIVALLVESGLRGRPPTSRLLAVRIVSWAGMAAQCTLVALLLMHAETGVRAVYRLGNWPSPYAIVLVLDRMSALMVSVSTVLAVFVLLAAHAGDDQRGRYFHVLLHLQLMGLYGSFLTGDLFNLFVFFEILLIASYGLLLFGGGAERFSAAFQYIVLNLVGSALFLVAVGTLYGVLGTLNMADVGRAAAAAAPGDRAILQTAALLLVMVFALKSAIAPLHLWLPRTYCAATSSVSALFAVMTKVGLYAIARIVPISFAPLLFPTEGLPADGLLSQWFLPAALLSLLLAALGASSASHLKEFVCFMVLMSAGTTAIGITLFTPSGYEAAIYYLVQSTFVLGAYFLLAERVAAARGSLGDRLSGGILIHHLRQLSVLFLIITVATIGLPPLSGFLGKFLLLRAAWELPAIRSQVWVVILATSFLALVFSSRVGSLLFWNVGGKSAADAEDSPLPRLRKRHFVPIYGLLAIALAMAVFVEPIAGYTSAAAEQLLDREGYIESVLHDRVPLPKALEVLEP